MTELLAAGTDDELFTIFALIVTPIMVYLCICSFLRRMHM